MGALTACALTCRTAALADAPVCADTSVTVGRDLSAEVILSCPDNDGDGNDPAVTAGPAHGSVSGIYLGGTFQPTVLYSPTAGYSGSDTFTFRTDDAASNLSNTATATITVAPAPEGGLFPLTGHSGADACFVMPGVMGACNPAGRGLLGASYAALSPDGKQLYVVGADTSAIAILQRDEATGALSQTATTAGCWSATGDGDGDSFNAAECTSYPALLGVADILISPDGAQLYAISYNGGRVNLAYFDRNATTGALSNPRCLSGDGDDSAGNSSVCTVGHADGLAISNALAMSPDGKFLYLAGSNLSTAFTISIIARNLATGALTQATGTSGCLSSDITGCTIPTPALRAAGGPSSLAISPDGDHLYVASYSEGGVVAFQRDSSTGALTQLAGSAGCITDTGGSGGATYVSNITLPGGKTAQVRFSDSASQSAAEQLLRELAQAKGAAS